MIIDKNNFSISHFLEFPSLSKFSRKLMAERRGHLSEAAKFSSGSGAILEFGTNSGTTLKHLATTFLNDQIFGFDSWEGLPDEWCKSNNEYFEPGSLKSDPPDITNFLNVELVKGWFNETIPLWLQKHQQERIKFIHIDCDIYSSTRDALFLLNDNISADTIISFDEFYSWGDETQYPTWAEHEFKALHEWVSTFDRQIAIVTKGAWEQCAIKVLK